MGAAAAAMAGVAFGFAVSGNVVAGAIVLSTAIVAFVIGIRFNDTEMQKVIAEIRLLERRINELAGEDLLSWETRHGLPTEGHAQRWRQFLSGSSN
jgi:hypothetical protein